MIGVLGMLSLMVSLKVFASENNTNFLNPSFNNMSLSQALRMGDLSERASEKTIFLKTYTPPRSLMVTTPNCFQSYLTIQSRRDPN